MASLEIPTYYPEDIRNKADQFLARHHPTGEIPIPIEQIVEFQLGIDIFPLPGLEEAAQIVGYTTSDLSTVCLDRWVYEHQPGRYRFTLAHEVGHIVLHADFYRSLGIRSLTDVQRFLGQISEKDYGLVEWHAYQFAGFLLVPQARLVEEVESCRRRVFELGVNLQGQKDFAAALVESCLAQSFDVSTEVITRRLVRDGIRLP